MSDGPRQFAGDRHHITDPQRLKAVSRSQLRDSPREEYFDQLTMLVHEVIGTPVAMFTVVDDKKQFFKSAYGVAEPWHTRRETPISYSFCQHVIALQEPLWIEDALENPLVCDNPGTEALQMKAYLGVPILSGDGQVIGALSAIDTAPRKWSKSDQKFLEKFSRLISLELGSRETLQKSRDQLEMLTNHVPVMIGQLDAQKRYMLVNDSYARFFNLERKDFTGRLAKDVLGSEVFATAEPNMDRALSGETIVQEVRMSSKDGNEVALHVNYAPDFDEDGAVKGISAAIVDITKEMQADKHREMLVQELKHRVKNTLATVQAISSQTLRNATDLEQFEHVFRGRLHAIASAHDILTQSDYQGIHLRTLISRQVEPYVTTDSGRLILDGPDIYLSGQSAQSLGLVMHELATNASKYGALCQSTGKIHIDWHTLEKGEVPSISLNWAELGGPPVKAPEKTGFGSRLIETSMSQSLGGNATLRYDPEGFNASLIVPIGVDRKREF